MLSVRKETQYEADTYNKTIALLQITPMKWRLLKLEAGSRLLNLLKMTGLISVISEC